MEARKERQTKKKNKSDVSLSSRQEKHKARARARLPPARTHPPSPRTMRWPSFAASRAGSRSGDGDGGGGSGRTSSGDRTPPGGDAACDEPR